MSSTYHDRYKGLHTLLPRDIRMVESDDLQAKSHLKAIIKSGNWRSLAPRRKSKAVITKTVRVK